MTRVWLALAVLACMPVGQPLAQDDAPHACKADLQRFCKGEHAGKGRLLACLRANSKWLSAGCARALQPMKR